MAPLTFADTHNMVAYLSKSDASAGFDQVVDFLNVQVIQYALMVNPTIYVSCIKLFWTMTSIKKDNDVVKLQALIDGNKVVVTEDVIRQDIYLDDADGVECLPNEEIFVELAPEVEEEVKVSTAPTNAPSPAPQDHIPTPPQAQSASPSSPTQEQPTKTSGSSIPLLITLLETCDTLVESSNDNVVGAQEDASKQGGGEIAEIVADEDITLVDMETQGDMDTELYRRIDDVSAAAKDVNAAEPTVFDDEEVTMTMAQTLIKMKAEKARLLDEQTSKRLHDEEVEKAAAIEKQEKDDLERAKEIPKSKEETRIIYLKNMDGYKMEHFRGTTYDKSAKLQVEGDSDMARDLVMKIFMEANKPKSRSLDTSSK
nr:hypothetical protein [Tanacetum cinerariifolium]